MFGIFQGILGVVFVVFWECLSVFGVIWEYKLGYFGAFFLSESGGRLNYDDC